jgi:hypothetical protein
MLNKNGIRIVSDEYADGGKTRKSGNVPRIAKKVAEVNALIEKGNQLGLEVVDSSSTWEAPMKYKPIKYVNGILYIEYEKLDLYALSKRGVQKWDIQKDKVLKRNMEFDNPLNDIAKMYRKAIREKEQYYAQGGNIEKQNMDVQFIEYKGNEIMFEPHYKKYYANDVEFDSLKDAQKFLDSGKISSNIRGAYQRGLFAKGGKIGFEGLANKVAKRYVGNKVSKEYQAEYGKTYDAKEAKEVGNKVAGKVYQQQVAKKKIVRKLQRKTN